jgi:concanavalin A-like lectin/glucanase superfamily protein
MSNPGPAILTRNNSQEVLYDAVTGNLFCGGKIILNTLTSGTTTSTPKNMILDIQMATDADEFMGLRIMLWAHSKGVINLLAVTPTINVISETNPSAPQVISQLMATQGVAGIGLAAGPTTTIVTQANNFASFLSQSFTPARTQQTGLGLSTAVPVLRQALASAAGPVDICALGTPNNLYDLLNSTADSISPLTGLALITAKVGTLYWLGGQYPATTAAVGAEYNFGNVSGFTTTLWPQTRAILTNWPTPIVFGGVELGPVFSVGAQNSLTTSDPVGYAFSTSATYQFGRQGWASVGALVSLAGPAKAGFSTVSGSNSINTSNGFNTFTAGPGTHSYIVPTVSQRAIQQIADQICTPGLTQPTTFNQVAEIIYGSPGTANEIDGANLINWYFANDIGLTNGASIPLWPDRCGRANLVQATSAIQPLYNTALFSKVAVSFDGIAMALVGSASVDLPHNCTMYAYVECNAFDATFDTILTHGASVGSTDLRDFYMDRSRTGDTPANTGRANSVIQNTFSNATATTALTLNTWAVIAIVRNGGTVLSYLNGTAVGSNTISTPANFLSLTNVVSNHIVGPLTVGAQYVNATPVGVNPWNGGMREIRIYNNAHTATQVAAISTAMTT